MGREPATGRVPGSGLWLPLMAEHTHACATAGGEFFSLYVVTCMNSTCTAFVWNLNLNHRAARICHSRRPKEVSLRAAGIATP